MNKSILKGLCAVAVGTFVSCSDNGRIKERPDDIVATGERQEIFQKIMESFPEHKNVKNSKPELFEENVTHEIVLTNESDVYVTFISEGASLSNTFGWYSYSPGEGPNSAEDLQLHVLFPHVSDRVLKQGDRLRIGEQSFPAGTVIGFFLIINGWEGGTVNFDRETFYTHVEFNPNGEQQHVLFRQQDLGDVVLAFEDVLSSTGSDNDFNDIIFTVTDNTENEAVTNFDLTNVITL